MSWLTGKVVPGSQRGRTLGFPTANIQLAPAQPAPTPGIYAAWVYLEIDTFPRPAAVHVGPRPTFADKTTTLEIHLLDFPDRELYGQTVSFICTTRLRDVIKFATTADLSRAIAGDCAGARAALQASPPPPRS